MWNDLPADSADFSSPNILNALLIQNV